MLLEPVNVRRGVLRTTLALVGHVLAVYVQLSRTLEHSGFDEVEFQVHLAGRQDRRHNGIADPGSRGLRLRLRCGSPS
jgi:hypothetical protein